MGGERAFKINTKKARAAAAKAECVEELGAFFACMMVSSTGVCACFERRRVGRLGRKGADKRPGGRHPFSNPTPCFSQANKFDADGSCASQRKALDRCVASAVSERKGGGGRGFYFSSSVSHLLPPHTPHNQASRTRTRSTINYHLQRLSRALRR